MLRRQLCVATCSVSLEKLCVVLSEPWLETEEVLVTISVSKPVRGERWTFSVVMETEGMFTARCRVLCYCGEFALLPVSSLCSSPHLFSRPLPDWFHLCHVKLLTFVCLSHRDMFWLVLVFLTLWTLSQSDWYVVLTFDWFMALQSFCLWNHWPGVALTAASAAESKLFASVSGPNPEFTDCFADKILLPIHTSPLSPQASYLPHYQSQLYCIPQPSIRVITLCWAALVILIPT